MKLIEIIVHIIGLAFVAVSIYAYVTELATFYEGTLIGGVGIALIVLNVSQIRGWIQKVIEKKLK